MTRSAILAKHTNVKDGWAFTAYTTICSTYM